MKNIFFLLFFVILIHSCKSEIEVAGLSAQQKEVQASVEKNYDIQIKRDKEYQKASAAVALYIEPNQTIPDIDAHNLFISSSGLPNSRTFYEWQSLHDINESLSKYKEFANQNKDHRYFNFFRQYESWLLITHYDLLSDTKYTNDVKYLLNELIEAKYKGFPLIYYCTEYLATHNAISENEIKKLYTAIASFANENAKKQNLVDPNTKSPNGKPLPPGAIDLVNKRIKEKNEEYVWIEKIKNIAVK